jgi:hypothetical protein
MGKKEKIIEQQYNSQISRNLTQLMNRTVLRKKRKGIWVYGRKTERQEPINRLLFESCLSAVAVALSTIVHDSTESDGTGTRQQSIRDS